MGIEEDKRTVELKERMAELEGLLEENDILPSQVQTGEGITKSDLQETRKNPYDIRLKCPSCGKESLMYLELIEDEYTVEKQRCEECGYTHAEVRK